MSIEANKVDLQKIKKFWSWFSENCQNFGKDFANQELLVKLDVLVGQFGNLSWEVGPGKTLENALVLSPNGDLKQLPLTKKIIALAKECSGWEYYYAKPSKQWDLKFDFETTHGDLIQINAFEWEYDLLKYEDDMFEIIIKSLQLSQLGDDDKLIAAEIALDGILGEELRIQTIDKIEIVEEFEKLDQNKASNIKDLAKHFRKLLPNLT
jgi:hypothetical protein